MASRANQFGFSEIVSSPQIKNIPLSFAPHQQRREIDETFDYRYSQLPLVFARLIREGHLDESLLSGLSEEKREIIRSFLAFGAKG
ncbi:hypothetical protein [Bradyrhizobium sp. SRL28]|uniref:hypothetical protein n=1 Tax=Bradyrhizobium sp. SRL28 TaxID=2836178 RepID=UPI0027E139D5|nr:hypothetical protein [Bradyrhizobium sp. SRL28]